MAESLYQQLPPHIVMRQLVTGYWLSQAVGSIARLGIADCLADGPRSSAELAQAVGAERLALYRVMRTLASIGIFAEVSPGRFGLTPLGETLRSTSPVSVRDFAISETSFGHWQPWGQMIDSIRTGRPMSHDALGSDLFEWYGQNPEEAASFSGAMGNISSLAASDVIRAYDFSGFRTIVDVGGAHGAFLAAILNRYPDARGILFDLPRVIDTARPLIEVQDIAQRCELVSGDFFAEVPAGADLHLLKSIVHDWDDDRALRLLKNCHRALMPGGRLVLVEMMIPPDNSPSPAQTMDLNMLVMVGGRERSETEYRELLAVAGFGLTRVVPTQAEFFIIEAIRD